MPWFIDSDDSSFDHRDPYCKETCRLLRAYNRDISRAKFFVKIAPNSPSGLPSSQWERILKGDAVDLNQIFVSLHHVIPDEERTGRLGDMEIVFGVSESKKVLRPCQNGRLLGGELLELSDLHSPIKRKNSLSMEITSNPNLQPNLPHHTTSSFFMTSRSETMSQEDNILVSPTITSSQDFIQPLSFQMVSKPIPNNQLIRNQTCTKPVVNPKSAINSTLEHAKTLMQTASTVTFARTATNPVTPRRIVHPGVYGLQPKYLRHNLWKDTPSLSPTVERS
jgi:hypothetical protein